MVKSNLENESTDQFFARLHERIIEQKGPIMKLMRLKAIADSADKHFHRLTLARKRWERAAELSERRAMEFEKETMLALLYEAADTIFIVIGLLELDEFRLEASADGQGIKGEHSLELTKLVDVLEKNAARILEFEQEYRLRLDFRKAVDEREGITFERHAHWQDYVPGSVKESFDSYFERARTTVKSRMERPVEFLGGRTVREQLKRKRRDALLEVIGRLERVSTSLTVEKILTYNGSEMIVSRPRLSSLIPWLTRG